MKDKTHVITLCKKEQKMLEVAEELVKIQNSLNEFNKLLKIRSESLRGMVMAYKKLQEELQKNVVDKSIKIGKHLEFYDYPKLVFKADGEDIFAKLSCALFLRERLSRDGCELKEFKEEK